MKEAASQSPLVRQAKPAPAPMPVPRAIFLYLFIVFAGAALIAPRVYILLQTLAVENSDIAFIGRYPFHRVLNRCLLILALVGLWPFIQALQISSWRGLGLRISKRHWTECFQGFAWGFVALALAAVLSLTFHASAPDLDHSGARWLKHFKNATLAALLAGFIEELLFRGALFGSLRRNKSFWRAALISSALYALLHFFERPENPRFVEWNSGFIVLGQMLRGFTDWQALIPGFINLTLVGLILALAFERTGSILFSFGLHAGMIFWLKSFDFLTDDVPGANTWLWGTEKLVDGWSTSLLLLALFLVLRKALPARPATYPEAAPAEI